jgi:hypothetical protein
MGQHKRALSLHERALAIREAALGIDHPDVAASLSCLASLHQAIGQQAGTATARAGADDK